MIYNSLVYTPCIHREFLPRTIVSTISSKVLESKNKKLNFEVAYLLVASFVKILNESRLLQIANL